MKIAIIGCSFSAYLHTDQEKKSWSYQLYQKFPQHTYYNYAKGGRSIDYSLWCLLDAKMNDVDFVIMNRTFPWRVGTLADVTFDDSLNKFFFIENQHDKNFYTKELGGNDYWRSNNGTKITKTSSNSGTRIGKHDFLDEQAVSLHREDYLDKLYSNIDKLYNFKYFKLLEFMINKPNLKDNVWAKIKEQFANTNHFQISEADNHWTYEGNKWVLENFILDKQTIDILTKG
jgi:hypothetical protein